MKENKKFFYNNRLNKGYKKIKDHNHSDFDAFKKQNANILPPIDIMEAYEEKYPGMFHSLINMAEKEQEHFHNMEKLDFERQRKSFQYGRLFAILYLIITLFGAYLLIDQLLLASVFVICAFAVTVLISYTQKRPKNSSYQTRVKTERR